MNILDYNPELGTFSAGMESIYHNQVVDAVQLTSKTQYPYNTVHKTLHPPDNTPLEQYKPTEKIDLAVFNPAYKTQPTRQKQEKIDTEDIEAIFTYIEEQKPENIIIKAEPDIIPHLNTAPEPVRDAYGTTSYNDFIFRLGELGYNAHQITLDEANYGVPQHRKFTFFIGTPEDVFLPHVPKKTVKKYTTVGQAIGDLGKTGDYVPYRTPPQNRYQERLRNPNLTRVTWHHKARIKPATLEKIHGVLPGSNNNTPIPHGRAKGYNRSRPDRIGRKITHEFFKSGSTTGDTIHPTQDRPYTIREGCRLHGHPDVLSFPLGTPKNLIGQLVHSNPSPITGQIIALLMQSQIDYESKGIRQRKTDYF